MTEAVKVSQADEIAAARLLGFDEWRDAQLWSNAVAGDAVYVAQAFARHRHESQLPLLEALEEIKAIFNSDLPCGIALDRCNVVATKALSSIRGEGS